MSQTNLELVKNKGWEDVLSKSHHSFLGRWSKVPIGPDNWDSFFTDFKTLSDREKLEVIAWQLTRTRI